MSLQDRLLRAGKKPVPLAFPDGSRLLVLPEHGRLLGLYPAEGDDCFLWTNPALAVAGSAETYFARAGWPNPGGDRTWLAPELELFIGDAARPLETYAVPPALDPGQWTLASATAAEVRLTNATVLRLRHAKRDVALRLDKQYGPAANPLRDTPLAGRLQYAGYTQATSLELAPAAASASRLGLWNLLQLPQPGTMLIPTRQPTQPQHVFGKISADELTVTPRLVRWAMAATGADAKISLKAKPLTGRAGHLCETATPGVWDLVMREFAVDPGGDYVDALWWLPHETGWAFQACCVRNGAERFNELEYHAPAAATTAGSNVSRDESRVWAFRGPAAAIAAAAAALLGIDEASVSRDLPRPL